MNIAVRRSMYGSLLVLAGLAALAAVRHAATDAEDGSPRPGERAWQRSCPVASTGLCIARNEAPKPGCGAGQRTPRVVARDPAAVAEAIEYFGADIAAYAEGARGANVEHAYLAARVALVDLAVEHALADAHGIRGDTEVERLRARYRAISATGDGLGTIAALARLGQLSRMLADELMNAPLPAGMTDDATDAYCDKLTALAEPRERRAIDDLATCVALAGQWGRVTIDRAQLRELVAWSRVCAGELVELQPEHYPPVYELLPLDARWSEALAQLALRNYDDAAARLAAIDDPERAYDLANARGVALRGADRFAEAEAAYLGAIAFDPARPDAYFNFALLAMQRTTRASPEEALAILPVAIARFEAAARHAHGALADEIAEQIVMARKVEAQVRAFLAAAAAH